MNKQEVLLYFGNSVNTVADFLRLHQSAVSQWGDVIPEKQALKLDRLTGGALKYEPSLYMAKAS